MRQTDIVSIEINGKIAYAIQHTYKFLCIPIYICYQSKFSQNTYTDRSDIIQYCLFMDPRTALEHYKEEIVEATKLIATPVFTKIEKIIYNLE